VDLLFAAVVHTAGIGRVGAPVRVARAQDEVRPEAEEEHRDGQRAKSERNLLGGVRLVPCRFEVVHRDAKARQQEGAQEEQEENPVADPQALFIGITASRLKRVAFLTNRLRLARSE
jgi:hypothetical protein